MIATESKTDILVVGGGISGLATTWLLRRSGIDANLVEVRSRFGGRIETRTHENGAVCDLGPSWFWPGQPFVAGVLRHLEIPIHEQYAAGQIIYQSPDGSSVNAADPSPMLGALRVAGGLQRLSDEIVARIEPEHRVLEHRVKAITRVEDRVIVTCGTVTGEVQIETQEVVLALPLRLAAQIRFDPQLPQTCLDALLATPTWMAGHAKIFAVYAHSFWRDFGLSGTALSARGPLTEIHDGSASDGEGACLWGFVGLEPNARAELGEERLLKLAVSQLADLFGPDAEAPIGMYYRDWSQETFTASDSDRVPQRRHAEYGIQPDVGSDWRARLHFVSSETSSTNGGLVEGGLTAAQRFVSRFALSHIKGSGKTTARDANMSWDWL
ncbi:MAG: flavin monoamine oxidase family protein [Longimicrobiales bacterium]